jgi:murein DD-endopeptidase MepM/ murein hydrolase activator NlpD
MPSTVDSHQKTKRHEIECLDVVYGFAVHNIQTFILSRLVITVALSLGLIFSGCAQQIQGALPESSTQAISSPQLTKERRTATVQIQDTEQPTASPTVNFTPTPSPVPPTPTPDWASFCTPLRDHSWDVLQAIVTTPFKQPSPGKDNGHHGVDFAYYRLGERGSIAGTTIQSVLPGRVSGRDLNRIPYGNMVVVETEYQVLPPGLIDLLKIPKGQSVYLLYAHMVDPPLLKLGDQVSCGQALGQVGNTPKGWSSNPHLHLEVRVGPAGFSFQSMVFYDTAATIEEMDAYKRWRMSDDFTLYDPLLLLKFGLEGK